jgi:choline monooxygenase
VSATSETPVALRAQDPETDELVRSLDAGNALPSRWYTDQALFELERDRVLRRGWHYAAHAGQLADIGDQVVCEIAGVPVVLVRDANCLRGFVNICRHRAHVVVLGAQRRSTMQCPYHAWTYGLDGCLRHAPRSDLEPDFDPGPLSLAPIQVAEWGPTIWVNVDPSGPSFESWTEGLAELTAERGVDMAAHRYAFEFEWTVKANWKVFLDNAIECYHCPTCHPELSRVLEMDPTRHELALGGRYWSSQSIPFRPVPLGERGVEPPGDGAARRYYFHWIFPTTYFQHAGWGFDIGAVEVRGVDELRFHSLTFVPAATTDDEIAALRQRYAANPTVDQDVAICQHVQRAHATGVAAPGRLLPSSEWLLGHFQRVVVEMVAGGA